MLKLVVGVKGTGKTKTLISMVNAATQVSNGAVICLEKGTNLQFDVSHDARLINTDEFYIENATTLYGFVAGCYASNHDITHVFIDGSLKICNHDMSALEALVTKLAKLSEAYDISVVMTVSASPEDLPDSIKKYM